MSAKLEKSADPRGLKRICTNCGTRFYDLNKRPVNCPECETEFTGEIKVKGRRGRAPVEAEKEGQVSKKTAKEAANDESLEDDEDLELETVSLDDVKDAEDGVDSDDDESNIDLGDDDLDDGLDDDVDDIGVLEDDDDEDDDLGLGVKIKKDS